jgi:hypothetical protein
VQIFGALFSEGGVLLGDQAFLFCGCGAWAVTAVAIRACPVTLTSEIPRYYHSSSGIRLPERCNWN